MKDDYAYSGWLLPLGQGGLRRVAGQCKMVQHDAKTRRKGTDWIAMIIRVFGIGFIHHAGLHLAACLRAPLAPSKASSAPKTCTSTSSF